MTLYDRILGLILAGGALFVFLRLLYDNLYVPMKTKRVTAVAALIWGKTPETLRCILSVSRKNDHDDVGLPGGKVDPGETPYEAMVREVFEETGVRVLAARLVYERPDGPHIVQTFLVTAWEGEPGNTTEPGRVGWAEPQSLLRDECRSFREYNAALFRHIGLEV